MSDAPASIGRAFNHRFTSVSKAFQVQVITAETKEADTSAGSDTSFSDWFGGWYVCAIPPTRETDAKGVTTAATELLTNDTGDQQAVVGSRDVRVSKFFQDLQPGEYAFANIDGNRFFSGRTKAAWNNFGGFLSFDQSQKTVTLSGIPTISGGSAPYIVLSSVGGGLVSASGAASVYVEAGSVTLSGSTVNCDAGAVYLGKGAFDPVVTHSQLMQVISTLMIWATAHTHGGAPPITPLFLTTIPGRRVFAAK